MQKTTKQKIYETYIKNKDSITDALIENIAIDTGETTENIREEIKTIQEIEKDTDRNENEIMFGIELEYEGYDTDVHSSLIEDKKEDGSVRGDGLEINLKPVLMEQSRMNDFKRDAEKMMLSAIKHECCVGSSAGMHVHLSSDTINGYEGTIVSRIFGSVYTFQNHNIWDNSNEKKYMERDDYEWEEMTEEEIEEYYDEDEYPIVTVKGDIQLKTKENAEISDEVRKYIEWLRFLYSVSEREGYEEYGIGCDGTRGYTCHDTIELRVWRTTLDYRKLTARAKIAAFWLYHVCRYAKLNKEGYVDDKGGIDIWKELRKDKEAYDAYRYLAFNCDNQHCIGYSRKELIEKLDVTEGIAEAIEERSRMIKDSLYYGSKAIAKEIFKNV